MGFMESLNEQKKKINTLCVAIEEEKKKTLPVNQLTVGKAVLVVTSFNLLDTKYEFYGFTDNLRDTIN